VDHAVRQGRADAQAFQVFKIAPQPHIKPLLIGVQN